MESDIQPEENTLRKRFEALNPLIFIFMSIAIALLTTAISFFGFERPPREYTRAGTFIDERVTDPEKGVPAYDPLKPPAEVPSSSDLDQAVLEIDNVFSELDEAKALTPSQLSNQALGLE